MNAPERLKPKPKAEFKWDDPLLLDAQLSEEERMVRDAAHAYAQDKLMPRILDAFRHETSDPSVFPEMGQLGLLGATLPAEYSPDVAPTVPTPLAIVHHTGGVPAIVLPNWSNPTALS